MRGAFQLSRMPVQSLAHIIYHEICRLPNGRSALIGAGLRVQYHGRASPRALSNKD